MALGLLACVAAFAPDAASAKKAPKKDIAIQLYSVRDLIGSFGQNQHDYKKVLKDLADMGYSSVEAASSSSERLRVQCDESTFMPTASTSALNCSGVCP